MIVKNAEDLEISSTAASGSVNPTMAPVSVKGFNSIKISCDLLPE